MAITLKELKTLQQERLRSTYADFIEKPRFEATCDFFFGEVYRAEDSRARDEGFKTFYDRIRKVLGGDLVDCLRELIDLQFLTNDLDVAVVSQLARMKDIAEPLSLVDYEEAYYQCNNYDERVRQIDVLGRSLKKSYDIFHRFGIGTGLKALHRFHAVGGSSLEPVTSFLVTGYKAIRPLKREELDALANTIFHRETVRLDRIYKRIEGGAW